MPDAFISYSRKNIAFARLLMDAFEKHDIQVWIDWQDIPPSADWLAEVYEAIEQSDAFIFLISENSVVSEICSLEIAHAVKNNKRLIPIVVNEVEPTQVPGPLASLQWIFFHQEDQFGASIADLIAAIQTDQDWVKAHTRLQNRALEWNRKERPASSLLRGQDLARAETWLSQAADKDPEPTALQTDYIFSSRQAANRRQRLGLIAALSGTLIALALGIWAWTQRTQAVQTTQARATAEVEAIAESQTRATAQAEAISEEQARATAQAILDAQFYSASARFLASQASTLRGEELDLGLLLSKEAFLMEDNLETRRNLLDALTDQNHLSRFIFTDLAMVFSSYTLDPLGNLILYDRFEGTISVISLETGKTLQQVDSPHDIAYQDPFMDQPYTPATQPGIRLSADGKTMLTGKTDGTWILWDTSSLEPIGDPVTDHPGWETIISFSPSFDRIATLDQETIEIWDRESGERLLTLDDFPGELKIMPIFTYDESTFIAAFEGPVIQVYDIQSGEIVHQLEPDSKFGSPSLIKVNAQGTRLAAVSLNRVLVFDLSNGEALSSYGCGDSCSFDRESYEYQLFFDSHGQAYVLHRVIHDDLFSQRYDFQALYLVRLEEEPFNVSRFLNLETTFPLGFMFWIDPETMEIITFRSPGRGHELMAYDPLHPFRILEPVQFDQTFESSWTLAAFHPSMENILAIWTRGDRSTPSQMNLWDLSSDPATRMQTMEAPGTVRSIAFHPQGEIIVFAGGEDKITLWNWQQDTQSGIPLDLEERVMELAFSADGQFLAARFDSEEAPVLIWDVETQEQIAEIEKEGQDSTEALAIAFHPQEPWLAIAYGDHVLLWDAELQAPLGEFTLEETQRVFSALAFHPNGKVLATGGAGGLARWDLKTFEPIALPNEANSTSRSKNYLAYDPSGTWLVSGSLTLYDAETGEEIGQIDPRGENTLAKQDTLRMMSTPSFSASGVRMSAYAHGNEIFFWQLDTGAWLEASCKIANRNMTQTEWMTYLGEQPYRKTCPDLP